MCTRRKLEYIRRMVRGWDSRNRYEKQLLIDLQSKSENKDIPIEELYKKICKKCKDNPINWQNIIYTGRSPVDDMDIFIVPKREGNSYLTIQRGKHRNTATADKLYPVNFDINANDLFTDYVDTLSKLSVHIDVSNLRSANGQSIPR